MKVSYVGIERDSVCVYERETERDRERQREGQREAEIERGRERMRDRDIQLLVRSIMRD